MSAPISPSPSPSSRIATAPGGLLGAGSRVGPYETLGVLGCGATSVVYEARHTVLGRRVALKVIGTRGGARDSQRALERFLREGRAAAAVKHPHIVDVFDAGADGGQMFLAMELVEGETLAAHLAHHGPLEPEEALEILLPIAAAVAELHAAGVTHRDLKPANILIARGMGGDPVPKIADFGISRLEDDAPLTESGALLGTLAYMAPEQLRGAKCADELSDQFGLGVVTYECLTGSLPFEGATIYEQMHAVVTRAARPPSAVRRTLSKQLDAVVLRALEREPSRRYPSVDGLGAALLPFAGAQVRDRWHDEFRVVDDARWRRLGRKVGVSGGIVVASLGATLVAYAVRTHALPVAPQAPPASSLVAPTVFVPPSVPPSALLGRAASDAPSSAAPTATPPLRPRAEAHSRVAGPARGASADAESAIQTGDNESPIIEPD